jgi:small subunit ribosomal protein S8
MYQTDPVADMLTRIRNASQAGLKYAVIPASSLKIEITKVLESEGFVRGFRLVRDGKQGKIKIALRYTERGEPVIRGIRRASTPGCRVYSSVEKLSRRHALGVAVVSTPKGVLSSENACAQRVGGEVLAYIW